MSETYTEAFGALVGQVRNLKEATGETFDAYSALSQKAMADGALDRKTKELIALAIGISRTCEGCVISHARGAVKAAFPTCCWPHKPRSSPRRAPSRW